MSHCKTQTFDQNYITFLYKQFKFFLKFATFDKQYYILKQTMNFIEDTFALF